MVAPPPEPPAPVLEQRRPGPDAPNVLAAGTTVRGDLRGDGGFHIDGHVDGSVESNGPVTVGESGSVSGLIKGTDVSIEGMVNGDVQASGHIAIGARGQLLGDATGRSMKVADGGVLCGMTRLGEHEGLSVGPATPVKVPAADNVSHERWLAGEHVEESVG
jgi:cytoskeletal protein CcmA (bactofilin family)